MNPIFLLVLAYVGTYVIQTSQPIDKEDKPYVGNGYIGYHIGADFFYINGVYNGKSGTTGKELSHRAAIPNPFLYKYYENGPDGNSGFTNGTIIWRTLNLDDGIYYHVREDIYGKSFKETYYAHRNEMEILVLRISQQKGSSDQTCLQMNFTFESPDFVCSPPEDVDLSPYKYSSYDCHTNMTESSSTSVRSFNFKVPKSGEVHCLDFYVTQTFIFAVDTTAEQLSRFIQKSDEYYRKHKDAWGGIWSSGVNIITDKDDDEDNKKDLSSTKIGEIFQSSAYYLLSSMREDYPFSPSPGSISTNGYNGHIFWDSETWMLPSLLLFYRDYVWSSIQYRLDRNGRAEEKAELNGYLGAMFPWESAETGVEVCPTDASTGIFEQHISGDIVFLLKQWDFVTNGKNRRRLYDEVLGPVANFWASRVTPGREGRYEIKSVTGPDEYAANVNNSMYTNVIAQISLEYASTIGKKLGEVNDFFNWERWDEVSKNIFILDESEDGYLPEYEGYNGEEIKQADIILLSYPLKWDGLKKGMARANLDYYQGKMGDGSGRPAMTWSVYAIQYLKFDDINKDDSKLDQAEKFFTESYKNYISGPFHAWRENGDHTGATHFITGAGGFLQAVIFGYIGFDFDYDEQILKIESPRLLPGSERIEVNRIHFEDAIFNFHYDDSKLEFEILKGEIYVCLQHRDMIHLKKYETLKSLIYNSKDKKRQIIMIGVSKKCYQPEVNPLLLFCIIFICTCCCVCVCFCFVVICYYFCDQGCKILSRIFFGKKDVSRVVKDVHSKKRKRKSKNRDNNNLLPHHQEEEEEEEEEDSFDDGMERRQYGDNYEREHHSIQENDYDSFLPGEHYHRMDLEEEEEEEEEGEFVEGEEEKGVM